MRAGDVEVSPEARRYLMQHLRRSRNSGLGPYLAWGCVLVMMALLGAFALFP
jgi:hypothetical protein